VKTSHDELVRIVHTFRPGADVGELVPLKGGISSGVAAFDVTRNGATERMVLREPGLWALNRNEAAVKVEYDLLRELQRHGYPAATPFYAAPPDARVPLLIVEFLPGELHFAPDDPQRYAKTLASALARIHALPVRASAIS